MISWGLTLLVIGMGSFILPLLGRQFVIVSALGPNGGFICIGIGIGLLVIGFFTGGSDYAGAPAENDRVAARPVVQTEEQGTKQRAESFARLDAAERAADRAQDSNTKLLGLISATLSDIESRGTVGADAIAPLRAECDALQAESPAPFREALAEPYEEFERLLRDERIARDNASQEALARRLLERHAAIAAAGRAWRKRAEQLNYQVANLSLPKRQPRGQP